MKKTFFILAATTFMAGIMIMGCKKEDTTSENTQAIQNDTMKTEHDAAVQAQKAASAEEWQAFKEKINAEIDANETRIAEFKVKVKNSKKSVDVTYSKNIEDLEQKNKELKVKIDSYKNDAKNDWESFKRELNHDVDELDKAIKDFTVDNKK